MPRGVKPKGESRDDIGFANYSKLWGMIKKHMATGAYVEVITALEAIISARLWTYLEDFTDEDTSKLRPRDRSFGGLIKLWKKHEKDPIKDTRRGYYNLQRESSTRS